MKSTDVREINKAIERQAIQGRGSVRTESGQRVIRARTRRYQLQAKLLSGQWVPVEHVILD